MASSQKRVMWGVAVGENTYWRYLNDGAQWMCMICNRILQARNKTKCNEHLKKYHSYLAECYLVPLENPGRCPLDPQKGRKREVSDVQREKELLRKSGDPTRREAKIRREKLYKLKKFHSEKWFSMQRNPQIPELGKKPTLLAVLECDLEKSLHIREWDEILDREKYGKCIVMILAFENSNSMMDVVVTGCLLAIDRASVFGSTDLIGRGKEYFLNLELVKKLWGVVQTKGKVSLVDLPTAFARDRETQVQQSIAWIARKKQNLMGWLERDQAKYSDFMAKQQYGEWLEKRNVEKAQQVCEERALAYVPREKKDHNTSWSRKCSLPKEKTSRDGGDDEAKDTKSSSSSDSDFQVLRPRKRLTLVAPQEKVQGNGKMVDRIHGTLPARRRSGRLAKALASDDGSTRYVACDDQFTEIEEESMQGVGDVHSTRLDNLHMSKRETIMKKLPNKSSGDDESGPMGASERGGESSTPEAILSKMETTPAHPESIPRDTKSILTVSGPIPCILKCTPVLSIDIPPSSEGYDSKDMMGEGEVKEECGIELGLSAGGVPNESGAPVLNGGITERMSILDIKPKVLAVCSDVRDINKVLSFAHTDSHVTPIEQGFQGDNKSDVDLHVVPGDGDVLLRPKPSSLEICALKKNLGSALFGAASSYALRKKKSSLERPESVDAENPFVNIADSQIRRDVNVKNDDWNAPSMSQLDEANVNGVVHEVPRSSQLHATQILAETHLDHGDDGAAKRPKMTQRRTGLTPTIDECRDLGKTRAEVLMDMSATPPIRQDKKRSIYSQLNAGKKRQRQQV